MGLTMAAHLVIFILFVLVAIAEIVHILRGQR
jgi:hypothetical protein